MYQSHWTVDAEADEVEEWFRQWLTARGWELHSSRRGSVDAPGEADFYRKGAAHFVLRVWRENGTTHYDITFSDTSPQPPEPLTRLLVRRPGEWAEETSRAGAREAAIVRGPSPSMVDPNIIVPPTSLGRSFDQAGFAGTSTVAVRSSP